MSQVITHSFRREAARAVHDFGADTFKLALYSNAATVGVDTSVYTTTGEVSGTGYTAGGVTLAVASGYPQDDANRTLIRFDDAVWAALTVTARYGLIYNASKSNKAVLVLDFGADVIWSATEARVKLAATLLPLIVFSSKAA
jgi:hypothetical protein